MVTASGHSFNRAGVVPLVSLCFYDAASGHSFNRAGVVPLVSPCFYDDCFWS